MKECVVCGEAATVLDTEYDEAFCHTHATEYKVFDAPFEEIDPEDD